MRLLDGDFRISQRKAYPRILPAFIEFMDTNEKLPPGFSSPTALPDGDKQDEWQQQNRSWWESNPMRYDWGDKIPAAEFTREFYEEIDKRFFFDSSRYMPRRERPFDEIIPFAELAGKEVLEIGVGNGSHAQLISPHCKSYTGIDLTEYAVKSTLRRFEVFKLKGVIRQMDAEKLDFPDGSFDFIWTWGVIHHSANTGCCVLEAGPRSWSITAVFSTITSPRACSVESYRAVFSKDGPCTKSNNCTLTVPLLAFTHPMNGRSWCRAGGLGWSGRSSKGRSRRSFCCQPQN
jgi:2-polyprenyl-3-methyl-5-hydroxy-6-metoxy-1,4-benzoquinol methylase